jgi:hypothetical protein
LGYFALGAQLTIERIWQGIKESAKQNGRRKRSITMPEAERIVESICQKEAALTLPREALEYLARELVRLSDEGRPG